jgi:hypothetical protein
MFRERALFLIVAVALMVIVNCGGDALAADAVMSLDRADCRK